MITNGFTYFAVLAFLAAVLVGAEKLTKWKFFKFIPPVVLLYLLTMLLCTAGAWDMEATSAAYGALKNNILYAMLVLMLLRCDIRKILKLGPRMLGGFFAASISISIGFILTYAIMHGQLGSEAWKPLGALCGSWMGGSGNLVAVSEALHIRRSGSCVCTGDRLDRLFHLGHVPALGDLVRTAVQQMDQSLHRNAGRGLRPPGSGRKRGG